MKIIDVIIEDGRIVKGVNTTADVGTDEIKKQAAKWGFDVDKDGKPPTLRKSVKGSKTNVLFNLGLTESVKDIRFRMPNFDAEWDEAKRYPEFIKIGKVKWIELAKKGKPIDVDNALANKIENTEAGEENRHEFDNLEEPKKERFRKAVELGTVELPIISRYSDGYLELVAGNTRLTGMMSEFNAGKAWIFDVPDEIAVLGESILTENPVIWGVVVAIFQQLVKLGVKAKRARAIIVEALKKMPSGAGPEVLTDLVNLAVKTGGAIGGAVVAKKALDKSKEDDVISRAEKFAQEAHKDHKRKYTGLPYYTHLDEVRNIVKRAGGSIEMQAAALLHDTIEDTPITEQDIRKEFGAKIAKLVVELTDVSKPEDGNRATRKAIDRDKLAGVSAQAQTIKYADLISNGKDIGKNDPKFAKVYHKEKSELLKVMTKGNKSLRQQAYDLLPAELRENKELSSASEIYVDMDGVLADFFGDWAKIMKVKHWSQINKQHSIDDALQKIRDTENFWLDLPLTPNAKSLLSLIQQVKGDYIILSSPLPGDKNSIPHKQQWIKNNLSFFPPKEILIRHDKDTFAKQADGTPNILIDDYGMNIQKWESAGGVGFKHKDHKFERTAKALKKYLSKPVETYTRNELPQIKNKHLESIKHKLIHVKIANLIPVQEERFIDKFKRQVDRIIEGKYNPIVVDKNNKIVNGHHRYEAAKMLGYEKIEVAKLPYKLQNILQFFSEQKQKRLTEEEIKSDIITPRIKKLGTVFKKTGKEIRIVGGAVRDIALGKQPKDIDLATDATPQEMIKILDTAKIKHKPTGIEHGTITAILDGEPFEITTLRADVATDGRRAEVEFVRSWEEDAKRRDLTYNAMSMDLDGKIYDYFGGMNDLQNRVSMFVGDPVERIKEDYLRILRYFRFQSKLKKPTWDKDTIQAIKETGKGLRDISVERIWQEISKLLISPSASESLFYMDKTGVNKIIGLSAKNIKRLNEVDIDKNPIIALGLLVDDISIANKWKLSNAESAELEFYTSNKSKKFNKEQIENLLVDGTNKKLLINLLKIQGQDAFIKDVEKFTMPIFPITGQDLIAKGMKTGPGLGQTLSMLKGLWKNSRFKLTKNDLLSKL